MHGGLTATVLDEIMVWACAMATRRFAYCAELSVRYLHPLSPNADTVVTGELLTNRKGRIFEAKSVLQDALGRPLAEGSGKYLPIKAAEVSELVRDFVGDASWLTEPQG